MSDRYNREYVYVEGGGGGGGEAFSGRKGDIERSRVG